MNPDALIEKLRWWASEQRTELDDDLLEAADALEVERAARVAAEAERDEALESLGQRWWAIERRAVAAEERADRPAFTYEQIWRVVECLPRNLAGEAHYLAVDLALAEVLRACREGLGVEQ